MEVTSGDLRLSSSFLMSVIDIVQGIESGSDLQGIYDEARIE